MSFLRIPRKSARSYPLNCADAHPIPSLPTGYPQVAKFSGDGILVGRSVVLYLSRGSEKKDGSIEDQKKT